MKKIRRKSDRKYWKVTIKSLDRTGQKLQKEKIKRNIKKLEVFVSDMIGGKLN